MPSPQAPLSRSNDSANAAQTQPMPGAAKTVLKLLQRLRHGSLTLHFPDGSMQRFGGDSLPHATLHLNNWNAFTGALKSGDIGFAESFIAGDWTTPDLTALLRLLVKNRAEVDRVIFGSWIGRLGYRIKHWLNRNTHSNSPKNIHAHYDLGNAFYTLWLDPTMNYSSALFNGDLGQTLSQAQTAKVQRALNQTSVGAGSRVLEIGCGWGALAEMATARGAHPGSPHARWPEERPAGCREKTGGAKGWRERGGGRGDTPADGPRRPRLKRRGRKKTGGESLRLARGKGAVRSARASFCPLR